MLMGKNPVVTALKGLDSYNWLREANLSEILFTLFAGVIQTHLELSVGPIFAGEKVTGNSRAGNWDGEIPTSD
jgi:hypothetical protein